MRKNLLQGMMDGLIVWLGFEVDRVELVKKNGDTL
jgi:hypothetical protein